MTDPTPGAGAPDAGVVLTPVQQRTSTPSGAPIRHSSSLPRSSPISVTTPMPPSPTSAPGSVTTDAVRHQAHDRRRARLRGPPPRSRPVHLDPGPRPRPGVPQGDPAPAQLARRTGPGRPRRRGAGPARRRATPSSATSRRARSGRRGRPARPRGRAGHQVPRVLPASRPPVAPDDRGLGPVAARGTDPAVAPGRPVIGRPVGTGEPQGDHRPQDGADRRPATARTSASTRSSRRCAGTSRRASWRRSPSMSGRPSSRRSRRAPPFGAAAHARRDRADGRVARRGARATAHTRGFVPLVSAARRLRAGAGVTVGIHRRRR